MSPHVEEMKQQNRQTKSVMVLSAHQASKGLAVEFWRCE